MGFLTNSVLFQLLINGIAWFQTFLSHFPVVVIRKSSSGLKGTAGPGGKYTESWFIHPMTVVFFQMSHFEIHMAPIMPSLNICLKLFFVNYLQNLHQLLSKHLHPPLCSQKIRNQNDLRPLNRKKWKIKYGRAGLPNLKRNCLMRHIYFYFTDFFI